MRLFEFLNVNFFQLKSLRCSSSNKTCTNLICRVKGISRYEYAASLGFDVIRKVDQLSVINLYFQMFLSPLQTLQVDLLVEYKYLGNWRQIVGLNNQDACDLMTRSDGGSRWFYDFINAFTGEAIHHCPFLPSRFEIVNMTNFEFIEGMDGSEPPLLDHEKKSTLSFYMKNFFKGDFRGTATLKSKVDPKVLQLVAFYTISENKFETF